MYLQLFELAGNTDFKGIVCSPEQLKQYLDIPCDESCVEAVSESLCNINDSLVGGITEFLQQQLDISEIIKLVSMNLLVLCLLVFSHFFFVFNIN